MSVYEGKDLTPPPPPPSSPPPPPSSGSGSGGGTGGGGTPGTGGTGDTVPGGGVERQPGDFRAGELGDAQPAAVGEARHPAREAATGFGEHVMTMGCVQPAPALIQRHTGTVAAGHAAAGIGIGAGERSQFRRWEQVLPARPGLVVDLHRPAGAAGVAAGGADAGEGIENGLVARAVLLHAVRTRRVGLSLRSAAGGSDIWDCAAHAASPGAPRHPPGSAPGG